MFVSDCYSSAMRFEGELKVKFVFFIKISLNFCEMVQILFRSNWAISKIGRNSKDQSKINPVPKVELLQKYKFNMWYIYTSH